MPSIGNRSGQAVGPRLTHSRVRARRSRRNRQPAQAHGTRTRDAKPVGRSRRDRRRDERPPVSRPPPTPKVEPVASLSRGRGRPRPRFAYPFHWKRVIAARLCGGLGETALPAARPLSVERQKQKHMNFAHPCHSPITCLRPLDSGHGLTYTARTGEILRSFEERRKRVSCEKFGSPSG